MNILEKKLDGTPILNTMNSKMVYDKQIDPLMAKVLSSGLKGGTVTLYGQAGSLYSTTPADLNPDTLISITFELIPERSIAAPRRLAYPQSHRPHTGSQMSGTDIMAATIARRAEYCPSRFQAIASGCSQSSCMRFDSKTVTPEASPA